MRVGATSFQEPLLTSRALHLVPMGAHLVGRGTHGHQMQVHANIPNMKIKFTTKEKLQDYKVVSCMYMETLNSYFVYNI